MRVEFIPINRPDVCCPTVVTQFPVILTRSARGNVPAEGLAVSPFHCEISRDDGLLLVQDLGSKHGTFVNESRVTRAHLWPGDKLTVGLASYLVQYERPASPHRPSDEPSPSTVVTSAADAVTIRLTACSRDACVHTEGR